MVILCVVPTSLQLVVMLKLCVVAFKDGHTLPVVVHNMVLYCGWVADIMIFALSTRPARSFVLINLHLQGHCNHVTT